MRPWELKSVNPIKSYEGKAVFVQFVKVSQFLVSMFLQKVAWTLQISL